MAAKAPERGKAGRGFKDGHKKSPEPQVGDGSKHPWGWGRVLEGEIGVGGSRGPSLDQLSTSGFLCEIESFPQACLHLVLASDELHSSRLQIHELG